MPAEEARQVIGIDSQAELLSDFHKKIVSNAGVLLRMSLSTPFHQKSGMKLKLLKYVSRRVRDEWWS
jgi:hypothetical protein